MIQLGGVIEVFGRGGRLRAWAIGTKLRQERLQRASRSDIREKLIEALQQEGEPWPSGDSASDSKPTTGDRKSKSDEGVERLIGELTTGGGGEIVDRKHIDIAASR